MSNFEGLSSQQDWREQYTSFALPGENGLLSPSPSYEQATSPEVSHGQTQQHTSGRPPLGHRHSMVSSRQDVQPVALIERPNSAPEDCGNQIDESIRDESLIPTEPPTITIDSLGSNRLRSVSSASQQHNMLSNSNEGGDMHGDIKEEDDDEELDDDEMLDAEEGGVHQTAAERRAERRKMKRFRYSFLEQNCGEIILTAVQSNPPTNSIFDERVCKASASRCLPSRTLIKRNTWVKSETSPSLVPKQVRETLPNFMM